MAHYVKNANIFGRLGSGIGQGLAEQVPKEIEHQRLRSGLQELAKKADAGQISQASLLAEAAGTYGISPQAVQSFGEIGKQQARGQALIQSQQQQQQPQQSPFDQLRSNDGTQAQESATPSITKAGPLGKIQKGYISPDQDQRVAEAGKAYAASPAFFGNDPQKAIDFIDKKYAIEEKRNEDYQKQHAKLEEIQNKVVDKLKTEAKGYGIKLPGDQGAGTVIPQDIYNDVENEAIQSTKPKSEGGQGLTEHQAIREAGKKLHEIAQDYQDLESQGGWGITGRTAQDSFNAITALRHRFEKRGDTKNLAEGLVAKYNISFMQGYAMAEPVSNNDHLNNTLHSLEDLKPLAKTIGGIGENAPILNLPGGKNLKKVPDEISRPRTQVIMPLIARDLKVEGKNGLRPSPLSIAYELDKKGYSPEVFFEYLNKHKDKLGLTGYQERQLQKPINRIEPLNGWWLSAWSGIDESKKSNRRK